MTTTPLSPSGPGAGAARPSPAGTPAAGVRGAQVPAAIHDWRRWRAPAALVTAILLGGMVIALLAKSPPVTGELDPRNVGPAGTHALAALLARRGKTVITAVTAASAAAEAQGTDTTLVITRPQVLGPASIGALSRARADMLIVAPSAAVLARLAPAVTLAATAPVGTDAPRCGLPAARLAGSADMGGLLLRTTAPGSWRCYPAGASAAGRAAGSQTRGPAAGPVTGPVSLVRYTSGGRTITVLGTGAPLTNHDLGSGGNAALALNLLDTSARIVWLVPGPLAAARAAAGGHGSLTSLIPRAAYLVLAEIVVAVLLAAAWRMRRFGPLVSEPLPVVVHASETVRGHGRLYRARRARDRAAAALRAAALTRITARLGLPPDVPRTAICQELAPRTGRGPEEIEALLFGPAPRDDAALVALATDLDTMEGQVFA